MQLIIFHYFVPLFINFINIFSFLYFFPPSRRSNSSLKVWYEYKIHIKPHGDFYCRTSPVVSDLTERLWSTWVTWRAGTTRTTWRCTTWICCLWTTLWTMASRRTDRSTWPHPSCTRCTTTRPTWEESCCSARGITTWYRAASHPGYLPAQFEYFS